MPSAIGPAYIAFATTRRRLRLRRRGLDDGSRADFEPATPPLPSSRARGRPVSPLLLPTRASRLPASWPPLAAANRSAGRRRRVSASALTASLSAMAPVPPFAGSAFLGCPTCAAAGSAGELPVGFAASMLGSGCRVANAGSCRRRRLLRRFRVRRPGRLRLRRFGGRYLGLHRRSGRRFDLCPMLLGSPGEAAGGVASTAHVGVAGGSVRSAGMISSGRAPAGRVATGRTFAVSLESPASRRLPPCDVSLALIGFVPFPRTGGGRSRVPSGRRKRPLANAAHELGARFRPASRGSDTASIAGSCSPSGFGCEVRTAQTCRSSPACGIVTRIGVVGRPSRVVLFSQ